MRLYRNDVFGTQISFGKILDGRNRLIREFERTNVIRSIAVIRSIVPQQNRVRYWPWFHQHTSVKRVSSLCILETFRFCRSNDQKIAVLISNTWSCSDCLNTGEPALSAWSTGTEILSPETPVYSSIVQGYRKRLDGIYRELWSLHRNPLQTAHSAGITSLLKRISENKLALC